VTGGYSREADSDSVNLGSNPGPPAIDIVVKSAPKGAFFMSQWPRDVSRVFSTIYAGSRHFVAVGRDMKRNMANEGRQSL
jgi:hypothetical protein